LGHSRHPLQPSARGALHPELPCRAAFL